MSGFHQDQILEVCPPQGAMGHGMTSNLYTTHKAKLKASRVTLDQAKVELATDWPVNC